MKVVHSASELRKDLKGPCVLIPTMGALHEGHAALIRAGIAAQVGDVQQAIARLDLAASGFDAADMRLHAACARRRKGELLGPAGAPLVAEADAFMASQAIARPAQWSAMYNGSIAHVTHPT